MRYQAYAGDAVSGPHSLRKGYRTDLDFLARTAVTSLVVLAFGYWFFVRFRDRFGERL